MATSDTLGLFMSPEQYQAQQLAQQQANEQQRAFNFAQLNPRDQAVYGMFLGGQQLGRGLGGLLGVQDPQLQRIRQRQEIMQSINPADANSLMAGIQRASQAGDNELALSLTDFMREQESKIQLGRQRQAQATREQKQAIPADILKARELAGLNADLDELLATPETPERNRMINMLRTQITALEQPEKITPDMSNAMALADLLNKDRTSDAWKKEYRAQLTRLTTKPENEKKSAFAQQLEDAGYIPGSPAYVSKMDEYISKEIKGRDVAEKKSAFAQQLEDAGYIPGSPAYVSMMDKFLTKELTPKEEKGLAFGTDREAIAAELYGKPFKDLTQTQQAAVNKRKEDEEQKKKPVTQIQNVMPGQGKDGLTGIGKFRNEVGESIKPFRATVNAADAALQNINDSIKSNNFTSFNAARVQLAKALGDSTLSRRDIEQAGGDPSLLGGFFDATSTLFTGTPTVDTQNKIKSTLQAIRKVARKKAQDELGVQRQLGIRAGYTNEDINMAFNFPEIMGGGDGAPKPENKKTVPFNALPK